MFVERWDRGSVGSTGSWLAAGLRFSRGQPQSQAGVQLCRSCLAANSRVFCAGLEFVFERFRNRKKWLLGTDAGRIAESCVAELQSRLWVAFGGPQGGSLVAKLSEGK